MKTFTEMVNYQIEYGWLEDILEELDDLGYAVQSDYNNKITVYLLGEDVPREEGYDKLAKLLTHMRVYITLAKEPMVDDRRVTGKIIFYYDANKHTEVAGRFYQHIYANALYTRHLSHDDRYYPEWKEVVSVQP